MVQGALYGRHFVPNASLVFVEVLSGPGAGFIYDVREDRQVPEKAKRGGQSLTRAAIGALGGTPSFEVADLRITTRAASLVITAPSKRVLPTILRD